MTFAKTFLISIGAFIALNVILFFTIFEGGTGPEDYIDLVQDQPYYILQPLFGPIFVATGPEGVIILFITSSSLKVITWIGYIATPLVAAILSGHFGENEKEKIGGWFLTAILSAIIVLIGGIIQLSDLGATAEEIGDFAAIVIGTGIILGIFYSFFALIMPEKS